MLPMNVTLINKSIRIKTSDLQDMVDWLSSCYGEMSLPVRLVVVDTPRKHDVRGRAYYPVTTDRRVIKRGEYVMKIEVGNPVSYPRTYSYKKRAGAIKLYSEMERIFKVIAHEMRHIEQFDACSLAVKACHPMFEDMPVYRNRFSKAFKLWEAKEYSYGSCEVDAEQVAIPVTKAWQESKEIEASVRLAS